MSDRHLSVAELAILEALYLDGMTEDMRDIAHCLYEALALQDERAGCAAPTGEWGQKLRAMAAQCMAQLLHLCEQKGGGQVYLPKGVAVRLSLRDREMCAKFRGDYRTLAREYGLTEVRVRQIVDTYQRERFLRRQSDLPGMDAA